MAIAWNPDFHPGFRLESFVVTLNRYVRIGAFDSVSIAENVTVTRV